jgi:hypothetical protein
MTFRPFITICILLLVFCSCQKGAEIQPYQEFTKVNISGLPQDYHVQYNGVELQAFRRGPLEANFRIPKGESTLSVTNKEGQQLTEMNIQLTSDADTLAFVNVGSNASFLKNTISSESFQQDVVKFQLANFSDHPSGTVNLLVMPLDNSANFLGAGDTIRNVSAGFGNTFQEVSIKGIDQAGVYQFMIYLLDQNNQPILQDNLPIAFLMIANTDYTVQPARLHTIYTGYFSLKAEFYMGPLEGYGPVGNGAAVYGPDVSKTLFSK